MNFSRGLLVVVMTSFLAVQGSAQNDALEHELNQLYSKQLAAEQMIQEQQTAKAESAPVVVAPEATAAAAAAPAPNVTVNQVTVTGAAAKSESLSAPMDPAIQTQPKVFQSAPTTVEASPLAPSRADQLRKARQDVEVQTEQAIVEQLEASRLELEKKRADQLLKKISSADEVAPQSVQVVPAQTVQAAPAPAVDPAQKAEINQLKQEVQALKTEQERPKDDNYLSFGIGMPNYRNVYNLKSDATFGLGFGFKSPNNVVFEGSLYYSLLRIERPTTSPFGGLPEIDNVDQYNGAAAVKYAFFSGKVRPLVGALASYTYREYSCGQFWVCSGRTRTHALDAGVLVGGEVQVSDTFSIGVEYQQLRNLSYRDDAPIQTSMFFNMYQLGRLEDKDYSLFTVRGRVSF